MTGPLTSRGLHLGGGHAVQHCLLGVLGVAVDAGDAGCVPALQSTDIPTVYCGMHAVAHHNVSTCHFGGLQLATYHGASSQHCSQGFQSCRASLGLQRHVRTCVRVWVL